MTHTSFKDLKKYCYFSSLSDGALELLSKKLQVVEYPSGTEIIKEGTPADAFFFISRGEVEVVKTTKWGQKAKIDVAGRGEAFGEMALLTCSPRTCSIFAKSDVILLKLSKNEFEEVVNMDYAFSQILEHRVQSYAQFHRIKTLQPFALLQPEKMAMIKDKLKEEKYVSGENILTQGEKGDVYYIIKSGKVAVLKKMMTDEVEHVATMEEGHGFGEEALITDSPRNATVQAVEETVVWTLSKADFDSIMKSTFLKEINPEEVLSRTDDKINYLDVRMKMEFDEEHIPGAVHRPLNELREKYSELDMFKEYHVYCLVGARSAAAAFLMNSQGFQARSIKGGILNWPGPVEKANDGIHTPFKPT
jgi:CRP-like cAMP-binding protein